MAHFLRQLAENFFALLFQMFVVSVMAGFAILGGTMIWAFVNLFR